jgi:hypothetical protein
MGISGYDNVPAGRMASGFERWRSDTGEAFAPAVVRNS